MIVGFLAASATLVSWTIGTFSFLTASRRMHPALLNKTRLGLAVLSTGFLACVVHGIAPWNLFSATYASAESWLWLGLSGIVGLTIGDEVGFSALRILGARRHSVVSATAPAFAACSAVVLLSEQLPMLGIVGMVLSITGVMLAMGSATERNAVHADGYGSFSRGVILAVIAAACQGLGLVMAKMGIYPHGGDTAMVLPLHAAFMRMSIGFVSTFASDIIQRRPLGRIKDAFTDRTGRNAMFLGTLFGPTIGISMSLVAVSHLKAAVAQTIFSLVPLLVLAVAVFIRRERLHAAAIIGVLIALGGVILLGQATSQ